VGSTLPLSTANSKQLCAEQIAQSLQEQPHVAAGAATFFSQSPPLSVEPKDDLNNDGKAKEEEPLMQNQATTWVPDGMPSPIKDTLPRFSSKVNKV
jgi:hypothetical protein